jgi:hypothetical protein
MITLETSKSGEIKNDPACNAATLQALLQIDKAAGWDFVKRHLEKRFNYEIMLHFLRAYITHFAAQSDFRQLQHYIWLFAQIFRVFPDFKAILVLQRGTRTWSTGHECCFSLYFLLEYSDAVLII